ncbi:Crp/Fnr family transcriptional regulator [Marinobacter nanhaiticus D15-8W]|uniref:Crp/Fnr family transcriptional regulator n=1 Tax=Marinobacter nanhaiticus D15-8W TaxID=626887 RepID=N6WY10_9GAMM|nr:Crp/Fnr family transcriptional regulator [Marinobacter nanhaiticus]ENO15982.1 Crp/Fnr family transcriptional regulator [Marinobacter nanhaiticus D15-8W]BES73160.1 Crp/Fnr family transcriptional regulator [Marinobacter nanhaiticus D15-8W]
MPRALSPEDNLLIAALPQDVRGRLIPNLERVDLPLGKVLHEAGDTEYYAYFPVDCLVSLLCLVDNGASTEIAVVGRDGIVGVAVFLGGESMPNRAIVQSGGAAFRLPSRQLKTEFNRYGDFSQLMLRYTQALMTQIAQTAICNRHHTIDQRLCRRLLLALDRLGGNELIMTQERIASILGVRRESVTEAAGKLDKLGVILYKRGHIRVLDRNELERRSCECYAVVRKECERLLPGAGIRARRLPEAITSL